MNDTPAHAPPSGSTPARWYHRVGPGLITACVVIGPGSILTSSNVGAQQGYGMGWVVVLSVIFMLVYMSMGARLGVSTGRSAGSIISEEVGRWLAVLIGISVFFISAAFQFGNNLGVHYAMVSYINFDYLVVIFNALAIAFLLIFRNMYRALEKLMMTFVGVMLVSFALNLIISGPRLGEMATGFLPAVSGQVNLSVLGLIGTTFVTTAAFYQSYLVRQKGWSQADLKTGMIDVRVGVTLMALITLMLMFTPATQFYPEFKLETVVREKGDTDFDPGKTLVVNLDADAPEFTEIRDRLSKVTDRKTGESKWDVISRQEFDSANKAATSRQLQPATTGPRGFSDLVEVGSALEPLFKGFGPTLFFLGVFAAAYSSFLVNSMIGGFILADGLGIGDAPEDRWPKVFTILVLLVGMGVGLYTIIVLKEQRPVGLIVAAQAVTVLASPLVAGSLLWLTSNRKIMGENVNGPFMIGMGAVGLLLLVAMSVRIATVNVIPAIQQALASG